MEQPRDITYCSNENCKKQCDRNIKYHNFSPHSVYSISNFHEAIDFDEEHCEYFILNENIKIDSNISYGKYGNFELRPPTYLDGHFEPDVYDLVLWENTAPHEVTDFRTGEKRISTRYCFSIASLKWDKKEFCFDFESCGTRYLEHRIDGLEEWLLDFCEKTKQEKSRE